MISALIIFYATILFGILSTYCIRIVGRPIIDEQYLQIGVCLLKNAINALRQILLHIIDGNYD